MKSSNSPIIETKGNRSSISFLLFALAALGLGYFFMNQPIRDDIPVAQPIEETRPADHDDQQRERTFSAEKVATISANKMNVFYIGVENPIEIKMPGVSSGNIKVSITGGGATMKDVGRGQYVVLVSKPTNDCKITVATGNFSSSESFRVKRIPDPVAKLGNKEDGNISSGEFKAQNGMVAWLDNFDFDAKCNIQGFYLNRITNGQPSVEVVNRGGRFTEASQKLIRSAKPGDEYQFTNVKVRCPGDPAGRKINSLVFKIK